MKNFVAPGDTVTVPAPYDVASGDLVKVGTLFGVAVHSATSGAQVSLKTSGVFDLLAEGAASGQALAVGEAVYFDATNKRLTKTSSGNTLVGAALAAKVTTDTVARIRLSF